MMNLEQKYNVANIFTVRNKKGECYYYIDKHWCFKIKHDTHSRLDDIRWFNGNYFTNEDDIIEYLERATKNLVNIHSYG